MTLWKQLNNSSKRWQIAKLSMKRWYKVIITHIDIATPPDNKPPSQEGWAPVLEYEIECEPEVLMERLKENVGRDLNVIVNYVDYELLDSCIIGEA